MGILHAIGLGLCVLVTELACARERELGGEGPSVLRVALAVVTATAIGLFIGALGIHRCDEGQPLQQWLLPSVCIGFAIAIVRDRRRCTALVGSLAVVSLVLTLHYGTLVHGDTWIGRDTPSASMDHEHPGRVPERLWHSPLTGLYRR